MYGTKIRTCEKFDACTSLSVKKRIMDSFIKPDGAVRIVISTIAFAMGIDVPNIYTVVHWGPPDDIECYVQETGRGGRDGKQTKAYLYYNKRDVVPSGHVQESMRAYCLNNTSCRRQLLMAQFSETTDVASPVPLHLCCDVCAKQCGCQACTIDEDLALSTEDVEAFEQLSDNPEYSSTCT